MSRRFCVAVSFTLKEEIDFEKETKDMMKVMELVTILSPVWGPTRLDELSLSRYKLFHL